MEKTLTCLAAALLCAAMPLAAEESNSLLPTPGSSWCEKFDQPQFPDKNKLVLPKGWQVEGTKVGVPKTVCTIVSEIAPPTPVLQVRADRATGGIICNPSGKVDLNKTPILRWCWRVLSLPAGGDGRIAAKDDQPVAIYIGANDWLKKKSIAYRWENETPQGFEGNTSYAGGMLRVHYITVRNKTTPLGEWVVEIRNVAEDFKKAYGTVPSEFAVSIMGNSQYTQSNTVAEVAFLEFLPAENK